MCITYKEEKVRTKKWYYKAFIRKNGKLYTSVVEMPIKEDTTVWQKAKWSLREKVKNLARTNLRVKHLGKLSVYNFAKDARDDSKYYYFEEIWRVEVRDKTVLEGIYDYSDTLATLVNEIRLDKKVS